MMNNLQLYSFETHENLSLNIYFISMIIDKKQR